MTRFVSAETREVRAEWWDEGEVVTIRKLSFLDRRYIAGASTTYGEPDEAGQRTVQVDLEAMDLAILERGIAAWTLRDEGGQRAPLTREMLARLSLEDGAFLADAIHAFNPRRSAAAQEGF